MDLDELHGDPNVCSADMSPHVTVIDVPDGISSDRDLRADIAGADVLLPALGN